MYVFISIENVVLFNQSIVNQGWDIAQEDYYTCPYILCSRMPKIILEGVVVMMETEKEVGKKGQRQGVLLSFSVECANGQCIIGLGPTLPMRHTSLPNPALGGS